jgi:hypothetical protein
MNRFFLGLAFATLSMPHISFSQDAGSKSDLVAAINKLAQRDVSLVGSIEEETQEQQGGGGIAGGMQRIVITSASGGSSEEYQGDVEVLATKSSELVVTSKEDLPGIKVYKSGEDVLCLQAHTKEAFTATKLMSNLAKLVDWTALGSAVESASKVRSSVKGKNTEFRVVLDSEFIPVEAPALPPGLAAAGLPNIKIQMANPMIPTVVELTATFTVNAAKEIIGIEYSLQYNDPMKAMMANAMKGGGGAAIVQFGGGPGKPAKQAKPEGEPDLGKLIVYDFDVAAKPSEKVTEFVNQAKSMLKNRK